MLIQFTVGNFRSFKEKQTLHMDVDTSYGSAEHMDTHTFACETSPKTKKKTHLLKSKGIWGANASGKSNMLISFSSFIQVIRRSVTDPDAMDRIEAHCLSTETMKKPSYFEALFVAKGVRYRYGFEATDKVILTEWLFGNPNGRETLFFKRDKQSVSHVSITHFGEIEAAFYDYTKTGTANPKFRTNSLLISTIADFNGPVSDSIISYFEKYIFLQGLRSASRIRDSIEKIKDKQFKQKFMSLLHASDVGIKDVDIRTFERDELPEEIRKELTDEKISMAFTEHDLFHKNKKTGGTVKLSLFEESEGTIKLIEFAAPIIDALTEGRVLVIDEFDARFHPNIIHQLVGLFNSEANSKNAQLIFVTHDTTLMSGTMMRRDQIDFVEKNERGESEIYSLSDITGVRKADEYNKKYRIGSYGAIPDLSGFRDIGELISSDKDQEEEKQQNQLPL